MQWMTYFFLALIVSSAGSFGISKCHRQSKAGKWKRMGGAAMIAAFIVGMAFSHEIILTSQIQAILIGLLAIGMFGLLDDFHDLSWKLQLAFQLSLAIMLVLFGYQIVMVSNPFGSPIMLDSWQVQLGSLSVPVIGSLIIIAWLVMMINSINWADGIDGLAGGIGILGYLAIFLVSLRPEVNQPSVAIISLLMIGSVLGFWWFNFPQARIEAGTSGSYMIGFSLAALAIMAGTKIATAMVILALPVIDALWVVWERSRDGQSVFQKDIKARHLHYRLRAMGWSDRKILLIYLGFLAVMLGISLFVPDRGHKLVLLALETGLAIGIVFLAHKKEKSIISP